MKIRAEGGGYYGGIDGSEKITQNSVPTLTGNYLTDTMNTKVNDLLKKDPFSYNPENDQLYSSYRKQYTREGKRATEDAIGTAAAMSGGVPSTYAATAGAQAGNYYASQMADKVPELYQIAYNKYMNDIENERANINMLSALEQAEQTKKDNEYNKKWSEAITAGQYGDFEALKSLGITPDMEFLQRAQQSNNNIVADTNGIYNAYKEKAYEILQEAIDNGGVVEDEYDYNILLLVYGAEELENAGITGIKGPDEIVPPIDPFLKAGNEEARYREMESFINELINTGADSSTISAEIDEALKNEILTSTQAAELRKKYVK